MGFVRPEMGRSINPGGRLMGKKRVLVVTDSTADIPRELRERHGIRMVPLNVHFGDEVYKDQVTIQPEEFFTKLKETDLLPRTSQPSPADFAEVYRQGLEEAEEIVSIHISAKLSGTLQSAELGRKMVDGTRIRIVDSRVVSMVLGLAVLEAARAAEQGASAEEVLSVVDGCLARTEVYFVVDTLEYLEKNGRIGRAQAFLGTLLNVKPVLSLGDGLVVPYERIRGRRRVIPRLVEIAKEKVGGRGPIKMAVLHGADPEGAAQLEAAVRKEFDVVEGHLGSVGPVVGCHTGPGVLALAFSKVKGE